MKEIELEAVYGQKESRTIGALIEAYQEMFDPEKKMPDIARMRNYPISSINVAELTTKDIVQHCIERNKVAKPQTVQNDVIALSVVIKNMSLTLGFSFDMSVIENARIILRKQKLIAKSSTRERLPTFLEIRSLVRHFKRSRGKIPMADIYLFALFSTRRMSEITRLEWADNNDAKQTGMVRNVKHPTLKQGNNKRFKYDSCAWRIVQRQPKTGKFIFPYNPESIGTAFDRACKMIGIEGLTFHDSRHFGTTRLINKGYTIDQVRHFTLHDDYKSLKRYVNTKPEEIS